MRKGKEKERGEKERWSPAAEQLRHILSIREGKETKDRIRKRIQEERKAELAFTLRNKKEKREKRITGERRKKKKERSSEIPHFRKRKEGRVDKGKKKKEAASISYFLTEGGKTNGEKKKRS